AYTAAPSLTSGPTPEGAIPRQLFFSQRDGLRKCYEDMHRFTAVRRMQAVAEIRGGWYGFFYGRGGGLAKATNEVVYLPTVLLFPTMGKVGITGELAWSRKGASEYYTGGREGPLAVETVTLERHDKLLDALRRADAAAVASLFHRDAQSGVRDHVNDTGT